MTVGGDQEQVPALEKARTEGNAAGNHLKNRKLGFGVGLTALVQEPAVDAKPIATDQGLRFALADYRLKVVEIDAMKGLCHMELSRLAICAEPVPIEDPISRVAILLNLEQHVAGSNGMESSTGDKNITVRLSGAAMQKVQDITARQGGFEFTPLHPSL